MNHAGIHQLCSFDEKKLEQARLSGDSLFDPIVERYSSAIVESAFSSLFSGTTDAPMHPLVGDCASAFPSQQDADERLHEVGQRLFSLLGPEILLVLGACSLPLAFAAGNGVQVLHRIRRLQDDPIRRLCDTAQMVINVMQPRSLMKGRIGWRALLNVRLMHALVRHQLKTASKHPWDMRWGLPINQEDLAGTLLSFSVAVVHGLNRMGAPVSACEAEGYASVWRSVGQLLGIDAWLLPKSFAEMQSLAQRIGARQIRATPEGCLLAARLNESLARLFPITGYANSLTHFFLEDTAFGRDVATAIKLTPPNWTRGLVGIRAWQKRAGFSLLAVVPGARRRRSYIASRFVQRLLLHQRPVGARPFDIPEELARRWF